MRRLEEVIENNGWLQVLYEMAGHGLEAVARCTYARARAAAMSETLFFFAGVAAGVLFALAALTKCLGYCVL